jgi:hypothetical protein
MIPRLLSAALLLVIAAPAAAQSTPTRITAHTGKVTAPVELDLVSSGDPAAPRLRLVTRPRVDAPTVTITIAAEDGLSLSTAETLWKSVARQGEELAFEVPAQVVGPGEHRVVVTATLGFEDGSTQTAVQEFALNPTPQVRGFANLPAPDVVTGPAGRRVVEVPSGRP